MILWTDRLEVGKVYRVSTKGMSTNLSVSRTNKSLSWTTNYNAWSHIAFTAKFLGIESFVPKGRHNAAAPGLRIEERFKMAKFDNGVYLEGLFIFEEVK